MAVSGLAEGFASGFGLMSSFIDSKEKREIDKQYRDELNQYRQDSLAEQRRQAIADEGIKKIQATTAKVNAETANITAKTAQTKLNNVSDPNSPEAKVLQAQIDESTANIKESDAARELSEYELSVAQRNQRNVLAASRMTKIIDYTKTGDYEAIQNIIDQDAKTPGGSTLFDPELDFGLPSGINPNDTKALTQMMGVYKKFGAGGDITPEDIQDPNVLAGLTEAFASRTLRNKGMVIKDAGLPTGKFPNAPKGYEGMRIVDQGISDLQVDPSNDMVNFNVWTQVQDPDTGEVHYYDAALTKQRDPATTAFAMSTEEAAKAAFARASTLAYIQNDPMVTAQMEQLLITRKHGDVKALNDKIETRLGAFEEIINKEDTSSTISMDGLAKAQEYGIVLPRGMTVGEYFAEADTIREQYKQYLIYGTPKADKAKGWLDYSGDLKSQVPEFMVTKQKQSTTTSKTKSRRSQGLSQSISLNGLTRGSIGNLTVNQLAQINQFFDDNNQLKGTGKYTYPSLKQTLENFGLDLVDF